MWITKKALDHGTFTKKKMKDSKDDTTESVLQR